MHTPSNPAKPAAPAAPEEVTYSPEVTELMEMLRYKRPKGSITEHDFIRKFLGPLGVHVDKFGNVLKVVGNDPGILWSSHTDTVHRTDGFQRIVYQDGLIKLHKKANSSCLGADCTAGVWIMMEMIKAKVPGLYVFHYGEENGCIGSRAIAEKWPELLARIDCAVAFDRRGTHSVITHMGTERTCSEKFATSLIEQLPKGFKTDDTGRSTDTKQYIKLVSECTNISVGFDAEHTSRETLDVDHLIQLRDAMVKIDIARLVIARDKTKPEYKSYSNYNNAGYTGWKAKAADKDKEKAYEEYLETAWSEQDEKPIADPRKCVSMVNLMFNFPATSATVLTRMGFSFAELRELVARELGYPPKTGLEGVKQPSVGPAKPGSSAAAAAPAAKAPATGATATTNLLTSTRTGTPPVGATSEGKPGLASSLQGRPVPKAEIVHPTLPRSAVNPTTTGTAPKALPAPGFRSPGSGKDVAPRHIPGNQAAHQGPGSNVVALHPPAGPASKAPATLTRLEPITPALSSLVEGIRAAEAEAAEEERAKREKVYEEGKLAAQKLLA
ncbi:hypothetical protein [Methylobacterium indicum]|uniref:Peptidase M28 domain-containing protein n=1 Tax=Methylobacterium indicum TaxID=1775910 RepID=A0A8H8X008_9HYPH|nr:hypothetical protein [Methylobacterium indicum]BCM87820.1 hypothetical protein mvi_62810 [Methylobacterium indicum]